MPGQMRSLGDPSNPAIKSSMATSAQMQGHAWGHGTWQPERQAVPQQVDLPRLTGYLASLQSPAL
jgi:hypothetical protein